MRGMISWQCVIFFILLGGASHTLYFAVKFYAVDPCKLVEELTRYSPTTVSLFPAIRL